MRPLVRLSCLALVFALAPLEASSIQAQPPEKIFAASCATCHGPQGLGGLSWVDKRTAPRIAGVHRLRVEMIVRQGSTRSMPAFSREQITDNELKALAEFVERNRGGIPAPAPPAGSPVVVNILDADPWYADDVRDLFPDRRRVELSADQYVKVVNTGKTWHTITHFEKGKDSGFLGPNQFPNSGYYDADQQTGLAPGCVVYHCHLHPYMQVEICTSGNSPRGLTRAGKLPLDRPPVAGLGEIWIDGQTQEAGENDQTDGTMQVIDASNWNVTALIPHVGNNPHSAWPGKTAAGRDIVVTTSWHDNIVTLLDAQMKTIIAEAPTGAATAHVQVSPKDKTTWILTHHGADNAVEVIDLDRIAANAEPIVGQILAPLGQAQAGTHGLWFCDDGDHFITANSFSDTVSLYSTKLARQQGWAATGGKFAINPSVMHGDADGCRRGYTTNLDSASVSLFDIDVVNGTIARRLLSGPLADPDGNLALSDTSASPVRWASTPVQSVVSPPDATTHGRYIVVSNKASFNVSIAELDRDGVPVNLYTFPGGLGGHGVAFGRKSLCDTGSPDDVCYYAYIANSFEDYVSAYDLEKIKSESLGQPGSAKETVRLEGEVAAVLCEDLALECAAGEIGPVLDVPIVALCPDCRSGVHAGDIPLRLTTRGKYAYLKQELWIDDTTLGGSLAGERTVDLEVDTNTGGFGAVVRPAAPPW